MIVILLHLLLICFLCFLAMIAYRVLSKDSKSIVKLLHMAIQAIAFGFGVLGLKAVFDFHNHNNISNLYSLHSWIGITTFVLFSCQVLYNSTYLQYSVTCSSNYVPYLDHFLPRLTPDNFIH